MDNIKSFADRCFNPFEKEKHKKKRDLRSVPEFIRIKYNIDKRLRVCSVCRKSLNSDIVPTFIPRLYDEQIDENLTSSELLTESEMNLSDSDSSSGTIRKMPMDLDQSENIEPNVNDNEQSASGQWVVLSGTSSKSECLSKQSSNLSNVSLSTKLPVINQALELLDCSPIAKKRVRYDTYVQEKAHQVSSNLIKSIGACHLDARFDPHEKDDARYFRELIDKLKVKFHSVETDRKQKFQILSLLPQDWSAEKIVETMETTNYMARTSKKLVELNGILSIPCPKQGKKIDEETKKIVSDFFNDERNSSTMPGKKDYLSIPNETGKRTHIQKKLILSNLKELYESFQLEYPNIKIGFSTFAVMRPKHCVLAGASGTHTVCVCSIHQNIKLMIVGCKLQNLTADTDMPIATYQDCINAVVCSEATSNCHLGKCLNCPKIDLLKEFLNKIFWDNEINEITFKQWITKPRTTLETIIKDSSDFIQEFCEKTQNLLRHSFIAKSQGNFMKNLKETLTEEEALVIVDFAENYAFIIQDAAPGFHWNNAQATLYTVVIYFKGFHKSLVVISDNTAHDAVAVNLYGQIVIDFIKSVSDTVNKVYYFSDGAPQQFKNYKNIANLCHHEENYNIKAEWHFFATAHGKGPCDGVGGTLKREAARASLQRQCDKQITTAKELFEWANSAGNLPNITVKFSSTEFYENQLRAIEKTFENVEKIKNVQQAHCVIPNPDGTVTVKEYSNSPSSKIYRILAQKK